MTDADKKCALLVKLDPVFHKELRHLKAELNVTWADLLENLYAAYLNQRQVSSQGE
jgi:hypothetical protein